MIDMLTYPFMVRAIIAGVLVALLAGYYGPFVVQRRMAFLGSGLAHGAFGGVALGLLLGIHPLWTAIPFALALAAIAVYLRQRTALAIDTIIGILSTTAMALGIFFLSRLDAYSGEAFQYLFGSLITVSWIDIAAAATMAVITLATIPMWGRWAYATFDQDLAQADRTPAHRDEYVLTFLIAATVVVTMKLVGLVLAASFLIIPAAAARAVTTRFATMTVVSVGIAVVTMLGGIITAYYVDMPSGAAIVLFQAVTFAVFFSIRKER